MPRIPIISSVFELTHRLSVKRHTNAKPTSLSVIISTYNNPKWLEKVLWGYQVQHYAKTPVEILVADDGSDDRTRELLQRYQPTFPWPIKHIWHPNEGFRKCTILNRAICASEADYLIFTDHDCIPRNDFLESHYQYAEQGFFLSSSYIKLPLDVSESITRDDIANERLFDRNWLNQFDSIKKNSVSRAFFSPFFAHVMNCLTTTEASWNGSTSSCWHKDVLMVNGFNEKMYYGGLDREFGERLTNGGIKGKQLRNLLICFHLDHGRPYFDPVQWEKNNAIRRQVRKEKVIQTPYGINVPNE